MRRGASVVFTGQAIRQALPTKYLPTKAAPKYNTEEDDLAFFPILDCLRYFEPCDRTVADF